MSILVMVAALLQLLAAAGIAAVVRGQQIPRTRMYLLGALNLGAFVLLVAALLIDAV